MRFVSGSISQSEYEKPRPEANRRMRARDPDDVDVLALALQRSSPVWTNDNDFEDADVECHTTAELLKLLGITSR